MIVLGNGRVGSRIARKLNCEAVDWPTDLSNPENVLEAAYSEDLAIVALPGDLGYQAVEACIYARTNVIDVSFMPEDAKKLHELAKLNEVSVISDMGFAPGFSNVLAGRIEGDYVIFAGGIPSSPHPPFYYKAGFCPSDVIQEYSRTARVLENGQIVEKSPLYDAETVFVEGLGTMNALPTDGLRSLLRRKTANAAEYTLRHPGHVEMMRFLLDNFDEDEIVELVEPYWEYKEGESEIAYLQVGDLEYKRLGEAAMAEATSDCAVAAVGIKMPPGVWMPEDLPAEQYLDNLNLP